MPKTIILILLSVIMLASCQIETKESAQGRNYIQASQYLDGYSLYRQWPENKGIVQRYHGLKITSLHLARTNPNESDQLPASATSDDLANYAYDLANFLLTRGHKDEAISYYEKALMIRPGWKAAANNLQIALWLQGEEAPADSGKEQKDNQGQPNKKDNTGAKPKADPKQKNKPSQPNNQGQGLNQNNSGLGQSSHNTSNKSLEKRLEELMSQQQVMITKPNFSDMHRDSYDGPSY